MLKFNKLLFIFLSFFVYNAYAQDYTLTTFYKPSDFLANSFGNSNTSDFLANSFGNSNTSDFLANSFGNSNTTYGLKRSFYKHKYPPGGFPGTGYQFDQASFQQKLNTAGSEIIAEDNEIDVVIPDNANKNQVCEWKPGFFPRKVTGNKSCGESSKATLCVGYVVCMKDGEERERLATCGPENCKTGKATECARQGGYFSKAITKEDKTWRAAPTKVMDKAPAVTTE
jgi:hypothetical protein